VPEHRAVLARRDNLGGNYTKIKKKRASDAEPALSR
jgi:hypothetical protein